MPYRTISDLPSELLHLILSHLLGNSNYFHLRSCSLTCRRLREVAVEYLFHKHRLTVNGAESFEHLIAFLRRNSRTAEKITAFTLRGALSDTERSLRAATVIDEQVVANIIELLPNVTDLELSTLCYAPPPDAGEIATTINRGPTKVHRLRLWGWVPADSHSSLSAMFRVVSMFSVRELEVSDFCVHNMYDTEPPFDLRCIHRPLTVECVSVTRSTHNPTHTLRVLEALSESLQTDTVEKFTACIDSPPAVRAIGHLLSRAGSQIKSLYLNIAAPQSVRDRGNWIDPLRDNWQYLDISPCIKLETIHIPLYMGSKRRALSMPACNIIQRAPSTLRLVSIYVGGFASPTDLSDRSVLRLQAFDEILVLARFPDLQQFNLRLDPDLESATKWLDSRLWGYFWSQCLDVVYRTLPILHARGLLEITSP